MTDSPSQLQHINLDVQGMTCAACTARVERALKKVDGVEDVNVNLATERASIRWQSPSVDVTQLKSAVTKAGYEILELEEGEDRHAAQRRAHEATLSRLRRDVIIAAALTIPIFLLDMLPMMIPALGNWLHALIPMQTMNYILFVLASLVQFGPGLRYYQLGWAALRSGLPDMNTLVMLGTNAAWGYSVVATFFPQVLPEGAVHVYFEAAAVIVTLVLLGKYMETSARGRTGDAIRKLMDLQPATARIVRDGTETNVALEALMPGDLLSIKPGERVPTDATVESGESFVDESMLTGESVPVRKEAGAQVTGGTVNGTGAFRARVTRVGADTTLAQIVKLVEDAQGDRLPIQALADRVVAVFVPIVIGIALLTFGLWLWLGPDPAITNALVAAVAVLIIACPCAMGLATPTSILVGTGKAAELGVLFRNGAALQQLQETDVIALDKTGTLTVGRPELTDFVVQSGFAADEVLRLVAAAESSSEHPIARALLQAAGEQNLEVPKPDSFESITGFGISATVEGRQVHVGADRFMVRLGVDITAVHETAARLAELGRTPLYAAVDSRLAAVIAVADPLRETSRQAIDGLHSAGLKVALISGDNRRTAEAIGRQLGIDTVLAEVLPEGKVDAVTALQQEGQRVTFVGDGINDAPALAQADVGIAIGSGTDVAMESADVVLMGDDLLALTGALELSRATMRNIRQNLFWAFFYNALLIPVAAGVLYPAFGIMLSPIFAAAAMALSSVFVLTNALRLRGFRPRFQTSSGSDGTGGAATQAAPLGI